MFHPHSNSLAQQSALCPPFVSNFVVQNPTLVSKEIGTYYPEFEHRIQLAPDAVPIAVKARPVLYVIEGKVADVV